MSEGARRREVQDYFNKELPELNSFKATNLCYIDEHVISGVKYHGLKGIFEKLGFKRMFFAFLSIRERARLTGNVFPDTSDNELTTFLIELIRKMTEEENHSLAGGRNSFNQRLDRIVTEIGSCTKGCAPVIGI